MPLAMLSGFAVIVFFCRGNKRWFIVGSMGYLLLMTVALNLMTDFADRRLLYCIFFLVALSQFFILIAPSISSLMTRNSMYALATVVSIANYVDVGRLGASSYAAADYAPIAQESLDTFVRSIERGEGIAEERKKVFLLAEPWVFMLSEYRNLLRSLGYSDVQLVTVLHGDCEKALLEVTTVGAAGDVFLYNGALCKDAAPPATLLDAGKISLSRNLSASVAAYVIRGR